MNDSTPGKIVPILHLKTCEILETKIIAHRPKSLANFTARGLENALSRVSPFQHEKRVIAYSQ